MVVLLPFVGGGLLGYNIGHSSLDAGLVASRFEGAPFQEAQTVGYSADTRDSISDNITSSRRNAITRTVASVSPAVVGINVTEVRQYRQWSPWGDDPFFRQFFGDRVYTQKVQGLGSGFIISNDGYILTNDHVAGNAKEITVTLTNGEKYNAQLVGTDQISDISLLKIEAKNLPYIKLGDSDGVITGEWVIALGNPFGLFDISDKPTVTVGVVSAVGINLKPQEGRIYKGMIQTDAAINSGNSGGPLVNSLGEVIGVNSVIFTPNQGNIGLGFAIPINRVKTVVAELKRSGKIDREWYTGLEIQSVDLRVARYFGLDKAEGVIVSDVKRGSPGERAGFRVGDIILEANGEKVTDEPTLTSIVNDLRVGDIVKMKVLRERKPLELRLKLEKGST
ncbi:MAG TPA: 2-alkenal reductase [Bacteroidetes bacterium]|nr:2-alkenal reductase [Bacteroidota bacterium]